MRLIDADAARVAMLKIAEDSRPGAEERPIQIGTAVEYVRMRIAEAMIEWLDALPTVEMPGWVCRKDRQPEKEGLYLTLTYADGAFWPQIGKWVGGEWLYCAYVHYWMEIPAVPEPPEENSNEI